jgi:hypothetical protein
MDSEVNINETTNEKIKTAEMRLLSAIVGCRMTDHICTEENIREVLRITDLITRINDCLKNSRVFETEDSKTEFLYCSIDISRTAEDANNVR